MAVLGVWCFFAALPVFTAMKTRDDDINFSSLMTIVQQQAATIQRLEARLDALENGNRYQARNISRISADISSVQNRIRKQVAFSAHMSREHIALGANSPFIFDAVNTNIGNAYNNHSGIFTVPYDGIYVFYFMMINDGAASTIHAGISKDGALLGMGTSDSLGSNNPFDDGSVLVTAYLGKGDQVFVRRFNAGTTVYGSWYTNFSGFLLMADD